MKTALVIFTFTILIVSCNENEKSETTKNQQFKAQDSLNELSKPGQKNDLIQESENLKLYGDTTIDKDKISYASIKFEPFIGFEDFKVSKVDDKKYAELDLKSNEMASSYRTRLREGYKADTANFAGHYTFVSFGCGTTCEASLVIVWPRGSFFLNAQGCFPPLRA